MKHLIFLPFLVLMIAVSVGLLAQPFPAGSAEWWNMPYPQTFDPGTLKNTMSFIHVQGNTFMNDQGNVIIFKGVNISDPDKLKKNGYWSKSHFAVIKNWGANIVRVPVHPIAWRQRGEEEYLKLLDQAVQWANELNLYLIIDWHSIGNLEQGLFQHPMYDTNKQETYNFWRRIASRYRNVPTIAFYEIFNEPTTWSGQLGNMTWAQWKTINQEIIQIIFAFDKKVIPLVAGFNWAYELREVKDDPIGIPGIAYVSHPYPQKVSPPWEEKWERDFGFVADTYPLFATEFGFMAESDRGAHIPVIGDEQYGEALMRYFQKKGISWTAWCFDPDWSPQLISDWKYTPTRQGQFFRKWLQGQQNTSRQ